MAKSAPSNPFIFATPLKRPEQLVGRADELGELLELGRSGTYALLEAPRRYGKTSLLIAAGQRWREQEGGLAVRVDFSRVLTIAEAAQRVERAYQDESVHGRLTAILRDVMEHLTVRLGPVQISPSSPGAVDPAARLHALLEMPVEVSRRTGQRALVAFDEFQDVLAVEGLDGLLRSHLQDHQEEATYVFAGSEPSLLRQLFADRSRPLYGQAKPLRLGPIEPELLGTAIGERFEATGKDGGEGVWAIAGAGAGHPQRTMLLAWHLWSLTPAGEPATRERARDAIADALSDRRVELDGAYGAFTDSERRVAVAVAHGLAPSGPRAQRAAGIRNRSVAGKAARTLEQRGQLTRRDRQAMLVDPLLAAHLRERHPLER